MNVVAVVQARLGSSRFPEKVLARLKDQAVIELIVKRLSQSSYIDKILVAIPDSERDNKLESFLVQKGIEVYRGSESDVLDRYIKAAQSVNADIVVRITGDCPFVDPNLVDECIRSLQEGGYDFVSNTLGVQFPDGLDVGVARLDALVDSYQYANEYDKEHVTSCIRASKRYLIGSVECHEDLSGIRWTVDHMEDLRVLQQLTEFVEDVVQIGWEELFSIWNKYGASIDDSRDFSRNEGSVMTKGEKLWQRALEVIPSGNMLLSKKAEMFLEKGWPSYFSKAKGCRVWDLDGREMIDMSLMGVGTNILGYGNEHVDEAVIRAVTNGNMSTLNCPEEVELAERLLDLDRWASCVRFARTGGEANAIAIRIARAYAGKEVVAICGYHGWHDWYLAANLGNSDELNGHLLPGLRVDGVAKSLQGSIRPFRYNHFEELLSIVEDEEVGVIKMEVTRNMEPTDQFLEKVRDLCDVKGIVLIFDECTSGFRETFGGLHKKYKVEPDIAVYGKTLGNGYAITAVTGKGSIMKYCEKTFISSTFWTERIGPSAGIACLREMERIQSWEVATSIGLKVSSVWQRLKDEFKIDAQVFGLPALTKIGFKNNNREYKSLITQEMLKQGFLAGNSFYASTAHTDKEIEAYEDALRKVFGLIRDCEDGQDVNSLLHHGICGSDFRRLN